MSTTTTEPLHKAASTQTSTKAKAGPCGECGRPADYGTMKPGGWPHHGVHAQWCASCYDATARQARAEADPFDLAIGADPAPCVIVFYR